MAYIIGIMGESGAGKTTSLRNLPPEETLYIDCDGKGLAWRGWRQQYKALARTEGGSFTGNYTTALSKTTGLVDKDVVLKMLAWANAVPQFKYVVVDTINGIMVDDEMARMNEKGYDKWADLAGAVYHIISYAEKSMREDMTVIFVAHTQTDRDDFGNSWTRIKTNGRKLDKIVLESKFPVILHARCIDGQYVFETRANNSTAKTPMGAFEEMTVPNDIMMVLERLEEYR